MNIRKFSPGQRVICKIGDTYSELIQGNYFTIVGTTRGSPDCYYVDGINGGWAWWRFEAAEERKKIIG